MNFSRDFLHRIARLVQLIGVGVLGVAFLTSGEGEIQSRPTILLLDTSLSMAVEDIIGSGGTRISRLDLARSMMQDQIQSQTGVSYSLITYAETPILRSPSTDDGDFLSRSVSNSTLSVQKSGSRPLLALALIDKLYGSYQPQIFWYTDGGGLGDTGIEKLNFRADIVLYLLGSEQGGMIPLGSDLLGKTIWKKYQGQPVISRPESAGAAHIATLFSTRQYRVDDLAEAPSPQGITADLHYRTDRVLFLYILGGLLIFGGFFISTIRSRSTF